MDFYLSAIIQGLCFSGLAAGIYLSMKIFNIPDITTDGSYTLGGAVSAILLSSGWSPGTVLPVVLAAGALAGAATGLIHTRLKVHPLLAGILVMSALYSVNLLIMGRSNIPVINQSALLSGSTGADFWTAAGFSAVLLLLVGYLLLTDFGIAMRATGNSESMIRALGVNTGRIKVIGLALANALTASSGYLMTQLQGFADINMGIGVVITGLGAVVIGETFVNRMKIHAIFAILALVAAGAVLFQLALAVALTFGVPPAMLKLVTAGVVLCMISVTRISFKRLA